MRTNRGMNQKAYQIINEFSAHYDPLHYVLLFPTGQLSWGFYQPRSIAPNPNKKYFPPPYRNSFKGRSEEALRQLCSENNLYPYVRKKYLIKQLQEFTQWQKKVHISYFYSIFSRKDFTHKFSVYNFFLHLNNRKDIYINGV